MHRSLVFVAAMACGVAAAQPSQSRWDKMDLQPVDQVKPAAAPAPGSEKAKDAETRRAFAFASVVRDKINDPKSFDLVQALVTSKGGVCLRFRAKNTYNATVLQEASLSSSDQITTRQRACPAADKPRDVSYIKTMF